MSLTQIATDLISSLGYVGLAVGLIVDSAGVPIPSEVLIPLAGVLARQGRFTFVAVFIIGTLAQTLGAILAYWAGATEGLVLAEKYGKYVLFSKKELNKTHQAFEKYGAWLAFFGRCVPVIRTYIGFPAGVARMNFPVFVIASLAGSAAWTLLLGWAGYALGSAERLHQFDAVLHKFSLLIVGLIIIAAIWYVKKHLPVRRSKSE
jgi:membrane protein DedA with SNARE-associated domain